MSKLILALIIVFTLSISVVLADNNTGGLDLSNLEVSVGSSTEDEENDTTISNDAEPNDIVEFEIELENLFDSDGDDENCDEDNENDKNECEIEDIQIEITIKDIDDGDDLTKETEKFEISEGDKKTKTLTFEIPGIIEEGTYDVVILIESDNAGNTSSYDIEWDLQLKVEKKDHDVQIVNYELTPEILNCGDIQTNLKIEIFNYGSKTENDVDIEVKGPDLNIREKVQNIELGKDYDKDAKHEEDISITISEEFSVQGIYPLTINVYYDGELIDLKETNLEIRECVVEEPIIEEIIIEENITEEVNETEEINETSETIKIATMEIKDKGFKDSSYFLPIVGLLIFISIIIIIVLVILIKKE
jgi:hypothetical protein